jgi:hypothetical protein
MTPSELACATGELLLMAETPVPPAYSRHSINNLLTKACHTQPFAYLFQLKPSHSLFEIWSL